MELGFGREPDLSGRIPARFINFQSQARGISLQVFLGAQKNRLDLENPDVSSKSKFKYYMGGKELPASNTWITWIQGLIASRQFCLFFIFLLFQIVLENSRFSSMLRQNSVPWWCHHPPPLPPFRWKNTCLLRPWRGGGASAFSSDEHIKSHSAKPTSIKPRKYPHLLPPVINTLRLSHCNLHPALEKRKSP